MIGRPAWHPPDREPHTRREDDEEEGRTGGVVAERDGRGGQGQQRGIAHGPCVASMTAVGVSDRAGELTDRMVPLVQRHDGGREWVQIGEPG